MEVIPPSTADLVEKVKAHAREHYNDGGWDVVAETYTDAELAAAIGDATTVEQALARFEPLADIWADRQADARNSAF